MGRNAVVGASVLTLAPFLFGAEAYGQNAPIDQAKFEAVYRASKTVDAGLGVGVTLAKFQELLQAFSTEVSIAKDKAQTDQEKQLVGLYATALETYQDSVTVWKEKLDSSDPVWEGDIPVMISSLKDPERMDPVLALVAIVGRHDLETQQREKKVRPKGSTQVFGGKKTLRWISIPGNTVQTLWKRAGETVATATKLYYGQAAGQ